MRSSFLVFILLASVVFVIQVSAAENEQDEKLKAIAALEEKTGKSIEKFSVKELKELLRERGVQCTGSKTKIRIVPWHYNSSYRCLASSFFYFFLIF